MTRGASAAATARKPRRHLARPIGEASFWTAVSRLLGFWRDVVLASILGAGPVAEAFIIALRLPNLFRRVFGEGAFSYAFIPIYARHLAREERDGDNDGDNDGAVNVKVNVNDGDNDTAAVNVNVKDNNGDNNERASVVNAVNGDNKRRDNNGADNNGTVIVHNNGAVIVHNNDINKRDGKGEGDIGKNGAVNVSADGGAVNVVAADSSAAAFAGNAIAGLFFVMIVLLVVAWLLMPWIVTLLAPGFRAQGDLQNFATLLARLTFPYLTLTALAAAFAAVCNAHNFFVAGVVAPLFFNFSLILALLFFINQPDETIGIALAAAVSVSGILQAGFMLWACRKLTRFSIPAKKWLRPRITPDIKHLVASMAPIAMSVGVFQVNFLFATAVVSLKAGGVSHIYYAERVYQLPLALIGVAIAVVLLPDLARKLGRDRDSDARDDFNQALQAAALLVLPASAGLVVLSQPIVAVLFQRGAFTPADTADTAAALAAFSLGLPAYVATRVMQTAFFAHDDTRSPLRAALWGVAVNIVLVVPLFQIWEASGVALATAAGGWVTAAILYRRLGGEFGWWPDRALLLRVAWGLAAAVAMALVLWTLLVLRPDWNAPMNPDAREWRRVLSLVGWIVLGKVVYALLVAPLFLSRLRPRLRGGGAAT